MNLNDVVFVGLGRRVAALHRDSGALLWQWKAPKGSGFVTLLLDGDRLLAGVAGYLYCLDPETGRAVWANPLKGFGLGVMAVATTRGFTPPDVLAAEAARQHQAAVAGGGGAAAGGS